MLTPFARVACALLIAGSTIVCAAAPATAPANAAPAAAPAKAEGKKPFLPPLTLPEPDMKRLDFLPETVARYNGKAVSAAELKKMMQPFLAMAAARQRELTNSDLNKILKQAVQTQIDQALLKDQCEKDGYKPDAAKATEEVAKLESQVGKEKFDFVLSQQGMKRDELVDRMSVDMMIGKWVDEKVRSAIKIDDDKIQQFYDENKDKLSRPERVRASHILFKVEPNASLDDRKKAKDDAEKTVAELKKGADFAQLARERSACPSSAKGGDLGFFNKGMMAPEFEEAAFALKPGDLSGIVETQFGYHIIKSAAHETDGVAPISEVKDELKNALSQRELRGTMDKILTDMRQTAKVEFLIPELPEEPAKPAIGEGLPTILPQDSAGGAAGRPLRAAPAPKKAPAAAPGK